ncbi:MAG: protease pro-enzyme activation domain-containing protein [Xanthobacteraceae bacterium]
MPEPREAFLGSARNAVAGARLIGKSDGGPRITVTVVLKRKMQIPEEQLHQHSLLLPHQRAAVDHASFARQYGASDDAIAAITLFAATHTLAVADVDQSRRVVKLTGSVADMEKAFGVQLDDYAIGRHAFRGRRGPLLLPTAVLPHVEAVLGLDNRPVAKPRLRPRTAQPAFYPQQLAALYKFPKGDGAGQTIALIELGGNSGPDDLTNYFAVCGLAQAPTVRTVSVTPGFPVPYGQDPDSDAEVMLDIEVAGAMAPGAAIVVYFAENTDQGFYQAVSQAVHDPATTVVSISWGSPEKGWSAQTMDSWNTLGQGAALLNVPIFVAAGDHGCTDEEDTEAGYDGQRNADFPGTCASGVVCCGGTSLQSNGFSITKEVVWNGNDGGATGGGVSTHFKTPSWQSGLIAEGGSVLVMRGVPDVSGNADPNTGINVRVNGSDSVSGGTSAVAPQWAAMTAVLSQVLKHKAGFFIPLLYANAKALATNNIVTGNNSVYGVTGFSAKQGWNACTGLGSPNGEKLLALLSGNASPVSPSAPVTTPPVVSPQPLENGVPGSALDQQPRANELFDPEAAVLYGKFVQAAYAMYDASPADLTPAPTAVPPGYELVAWIQMQDFVIDSTGLIFYGLIAQSTGNANRFVVALRGTSDCVEWWDDANAAFKTPFKIPNCGRVGIGFARIYDTLEVVERTAGNAPAAAARSLRAIGGFSAQIADLIGRRAAAAARVAGIPTKASVEITGHSLGAALATLYAMENARTNALTNAVICTFASPAVGDADFVSAFNALDLASWRIVNRPDIVPNLPPEILGFAHVNLLQQYSSIGKIKSSVACWHALATYLSLIDPTLQPDCVCIPPSQAARVQSFGTPTPASVISIPAGASATINITIKVGEG